jgi:hypothetical protein
MSATNATETAILALLFNATTYEGIAQNDGSSPVTQFYISLHTADPGDAGSQNTSETAYTGYARIAVTRDGTGWTVSGDTATNAADIEFGLCTASPGSALTHVGLGTDVSGAGTLILSNPLTNSITMQVGTTPIFSAGECDFTCS